jgi:hypothetical protein
MTGVKKHILIPNLIVIQSHTEFLFSLHFHEMNEEMHSYP